MGVDPLTWIRLPWASNGGVESPRPGSLVRGVSAIPELRRARLPCHPPEGRQAETVPSESFAAFPYHQR